MATITRSVQSANFATAFGGTIGVDDILIDNFPYAVALTENLDQDATVIDKLKIGKASLSDYGDDATPVQLNVNTSAASLVEVAGSGRLYHFSSSGPTGPIRRLHFGPAGLARLLLNNADMDELVMRSGHSARVGANVDLTNAYASAGTMVLEYTATYPLTTLIATRRARARIGRDATTIEARDGAEVLATHEQCTPGTILIGAGALVGGRLGNIGTVTFEGDGGVLDLTKVTAAPTWTALNLYGPGKLILPKDGPSVTVPAATIEHYKLEIEYR